MFALFIFKLIEFIKAINDNKKSFVGIGMFSAMLIICLYRNGTTVIVVFTMLFLIISYRKELGNIVNILDFMLMVIVLCICFNSIIVPAMGITKGNKEEALSIPLQQTARYVLEHGDEITEEEKSIINSVLPYDVLAEKYNPERSNNIKYNFNNEADTETLQAYFRVWLKQFLKHPDTYIQATLSNTSGYWSADKKPYLEPANYSISKAKAVDRGEFNLYFSDSTEALRDFLQGISNVIWELPSIGMLYSNGLYNYILLYCCAVMLSIKKYKCIAVLYHHLLFH